MYICNPPTPKQCEINSILSLRETLQMYCHVPGLPSACGNHCRSTVVFLVGPGWSWFVLVGPQLVRNTADPLSCSWLVLVGPGWSWLVLSLCEHSRASFGCAALRSLQRSVGSDFARPIRTPVRCTCYFGGTSRRVLKCVHNDCAPHSKLSLYSTCVSWLRVGNLVAHSCGSLFWLRSVVFLACANGLWRDDGRCGWRRCCWHLVAGQDASVRGESCGGEGKFHSKASWRSSFTSLLCVPFRSVCSRS